MATCFDPFWVIFGPFSQGLNMTQKESKRVALTIYNFIVYR